MQRAPRGQMAPPPPLEACLLVHERQRRNTALMTHVRNVPVRYEAGLTVDFATTHRLPRGPTTETASGTTGPPPGPVGILFVSIRYHLLHPAWLLREMRRAKPESAAAVLQQHKQQRELQQGGPVMDNDYQTHVILGLVDQDDSDALVELSTLALRHGFTLLLAASHAEAARFLEAFKTYERKDAAPIMQRVGQDHASQVAHMLKSTGVNKTDAVKLGAQFGTMRRLCLADEQELVLTEGIGGKKAESLCRALHDPFRIPKIRRQGTDTGTSARGATADGSMLAASSSSSSSSSASSTSPVPSSQLKRMRHDEDHQEVKEDREQEQGQTAVGAVPELSERGQDTVS